ncbi:hypothetical protein MMC30_007225 [Trapelia coarctata]|nr:hypothetical protein [Trapelia coarctata]
MSRSNDPDHFFQTTDSLAESARKAKKSTNKYGSPIQLSSKVLAIAADPTNSNRVYVAEAAGTARRVVLETGNKSYIFRGPTTPLTSLAISPFILYAGSWDKTIWSWDISTRQPGLRFRGHTDFVKCVLFVPLPGLDLLISGSSDATIILWNASTGKKLQVLKGHSMGVLALAIDPKSYPESWTTPASNSNSDPDNTNSITVFSTSSDSAILRWRISLPSNSPPSSTFSSPKPLASLPPLSPLAPHPTSIYALVFGPSSQDLYTASADGTSMRLSRAHTWTADTTLPHGDYVRSVSVSHNETYIVTAGRDEDVKIWSGDTGTEVGRWVGHYDEITGVVIVGEAGRERIVSTGIDGTVRVWSLSAEEMERARREREAEEKGVEKEEVVVVVKMPKGGLTAEEEAELAELMEE